MNAGLRRLAPAWAVLVCALLGLSEAGLAQRAAAQGAAPSVALTPIEVVRAQLEALQHNDTPTPDAGITLAWRFAHPGNRLLTGPLARFAAMLHAPPYVDLLNHRSHTISPAHDAPGEQGFVVTITSAAGRVVVYGWLLERAIGGSCAGCWLTSGVALAADEPSI